jgi:hypothetical protein
MTAMEWRLDSDLSTRWQIMRDLLHESDDMVAAERSRIAAEGWGPGSLTAPRAGWG